MSFDAYAPEPASAVVFFDRRELDQLLRLYGRQVAAGEWRDYAISGLKDAASAMILTHDQAVSHWRTKTVEFDCHPEEKHRDRAGERGQEILAVGVDVRRFEHPDIGGRREVLDGGAL